MTIITFFILLTACVMLFGHIIKLNYIPKRLEHDDRALAALIVSLRNAAAAGAAGDNADIERIASELSDLYNERAELDSAIAGRQRDLVKISLIIVIIGVIAAVTFFL